MLALREQSGKILRFDSTYKAVSSIGVNDNRAWVDLIEFQLIIVETNESIAVCCYG